MERGDDEIDVLEGAALVAAHRHPHGAAAADVRMQLDDLADQVRPRQLPISAYQSYRCTAM